ncbi:MAG: hypothetical protein HYX57_11765 [Chloroflexi bacterium]|nr:hypothetical protein [Chloroflexota bacterium]
MIRLRVVRATLAITIIVAGCAGAANQTTVPSPSVAPDKTAGPAATVAPSRPSPSATPAASAAAHGESFVAAATMFNYQTLAQFIRDNSQIFAGIAVVTVESASPLQWNTPDGARPSEPALHADWSNPATAQYMIGRAFTLRLDRVAWGQWTAKGPTEVYWIPGGRLGADEYANGSADLVPPPVAGGMAVALTASAADSGPGVSTISWLFPVDANGRVMTLDPTEALTLENLDQRLP